MDPHTLMKGKWGKHSFLTEAEAAAVAMKTHRGWRPARKGSWRVPADLRGLRLSFRCLEWLPTGRERVECDTALHARPYRRGQGYGISKSPISSSV